MKDPTNYNNWTKVGLIQKIKDLEKELLVAASVQHSASKNEQSSMNELSEARPVLQTQDQPPAPNAPPVGKKPKGKSKIDPSRYSTRYIALKLAYLGKNYGGFEFQSMGNQPSIEEELWNALTRSCLIFPEDEKIVDFECCDYSKCGRTDRGVSAFGQVIGLRVRSNRPLPRELSQEGNGEITADDVASREQQEIAKDINRQEEPKLSLPPAKPFDDTLDEIPYPHVLNRLLPKEIRILAWCPSPPPDFSARFSCRERQYRYFFTQPAFAPAPSNLDSPGTANLMKPGWLDIEGMRDAAKRYEGEHDFRNFCKIDPAKQITNFKRSIFESDIVEVKDATSALPYLRAAGFTPKDLDTSNGTYPKVYYFHVRGSAFLWHQIRHMVAILFLVGQRLEAPSIVSQLLDVANNPRRPNYVMADEVPLVLWDCIFPSDLQVPLTEKNRPDNALKWVYLGDDGPSGQFGQYGIMDNAWQIWREKKMDEVLAGQLLQHISEGGSKQKREPPPPPTPAKGSISTKVFEGGSTGRLVGKYVGIMNLKMLESADEQNDKYAKRKGYAGADDMRAKKGFRSSNTEDDSIVEK